MSTALMAESTSVALAVALIPSSADVLRAEQLASADILGPDGGALAPPAPDQREDTAPDDGRAAPDADEDEDELDDEDEEDEDDDELGPVARAPAEEDDDEDEDEDLLDDLA